MVSEKRSFESGQRVQFPGGEGEIIKIEDRPGQGDLLYVHTPEGELKQLPADKQGIEPVAGVGDRLAARQFDTPSRFDLLQTAAKLDLAYRFDRFVSLEGNRIDVAPHQVEAAHEILTSHDHRYLIADEVGLGKTIEAGIVIEELLARGRAERVLVVTPASLQTQWQEEMKEKFDRDYVVYDRSYVDSVCQTRSKDDVWNHDDLVVTSIDFAKQDDVLEPLETTEWDVAVFDEAHHLTARRNSDGTLEKTDRYNVGEAVSPNTDALLFLTGTPHKGKHDQFYLLLDLLAPYRFEDEDDVSPEKLDDVMIRRLKSNPNMVHSDGSPMFPERHVHTLPVEFTPQEHRLYRDITEYLRSYYRLGEHQDAQAAGFSMVIYQKRLVSSIRAIRRSLEQRARLLRSGGHDGEFSPQVERLLPQYWDRPETLTDRQRARVEDELQRFATGRSSEHLERELEVLEELVERTRSIDVDSKAKTLREFVDGLFERDPDEKVLVFTEYTDTLEYLRDRVLDDYDVAHIHGRMSQRARRDELERFRDEANVMVATDAAREGINLQFAHIMVNYDLPWNPIRIDQRMGRLHRYGQDRDVHIYNLFVDDTRESRILEQLVAKIDRIESDLGIRSDVLGVVLDDEDFDLEQRIVEAVANDQPGETVVADLDEIIEERKEAVETIHDNFLISDQFGEADLEEVQALIDESRRDHVGQSEVRTLLELFVDEYGGDLSARTSWHHDDVVFSVDVPSVVEHGSDDVPGSYRRATFDREVAREDDSLEFLSVNHPLVQAVVEYCLDGDRLDGRVTVKRTADPTAPPGIRCNFRLGYETADGRDETEEFVPIYVTVDGAVRTEPPDVEDGVSPDSAAAIPTVLRVSEAAPSLVDRAKAEAQRRVERMAEDAEEEKRRSVEIKRRHAERYFENAIGTWESRLDDYRRDHGERKDMTLPVRQAKSKLRELREERNRTFERLHEEATVLPKTPELVNVAVLVPGRQS